MHRRSRCHRPHRKRGKGPGKGKKQPLRRADILHRLQACLPRFSRGDEGPLQQILTAIAHGSAERGLIDLRDLHIAGGSTVLAAHASAFGRRTCDCPRDAACLQAWLLAYNERTSTERSHSRKRNDFGQSACRRRGRPARTARGA